MNGTDLAIALLQALPSLVVASAQVIQLIESTRATIQQAQAEGRDPSPAEWDQLHDTIALLRAQLRA